MLLCTSRAIQNGSSQVGVLRRVREEGAYSLHESATRFECMQAIEYGVDVARGHNAFGSGSGDRKVYRTLSWSRILSSEAQQFRLKNLGILMRHCSSISTGVRNHTGAGLKRECSTTDNLDGRSLSHAAWQGPSKGLRVSPMRVVVSLKKIRFKHDLTFQPPPIYE